MTLLKKLHMQIHTLSQPALQINTHIQYGHRPIQMLFPWVKSPGTRQLGYMTKSNSHRALSRLYGSPAELHSSLMQCDAITHTHSPLQQNTIDNPMISQLFMQHSLHIAQWKMVHETKSVLSKSMFYHLWLCRYLIKNGKIGISCVQDSQK